MTFAASAAIAKAWPDDVMSRERLPTCVEAAAVLRSRGWPLPTVLGVAAYPAVGKPLETSLPRGSYLVLGDNRDQSRDSRFFGVVDVKSIVGVVTKVERRKAAAGAGRP